MDDPAGRDGHQAALHGLQSRNDAASAQGRKEHQTDRTEGGTGMKNKWTQIVAGGIALLLAAIMLLSLIAPYIG